MNADNDFLNIKYIDSVLDKSRALIISQKEKQRLHNVCVTRITYV